MFVLPLCRDETMMIQSLSVIQDAELNSWFLLGRIFTFLQRRYFLCEGNNIYILCTQPCYDDHTAPHTAPQQHQQVDIANKNMNKINIE